MDAKSIFASKTFWANVTALLGAAGGYFTGSLDLTTAISTGVMAAMNIVMRFVTKTPIA